MPLSLFHAINPNPSGSDPSWRAFRQESRVAVKPSQYVEPLAEGVWLLDLDDPKSSVYRLHELAQRHGISHRILEFDSESRWQDHRPAVPA
jgi:hypothetical protein